MVTVPVITVGKIGDPLFAEKILEQGKADFIAMGRALLADPELPNKAKEGRLEEIRRCLYCNNCLKGGDARSGPLRCTVNPALCREVEFEVKPAPARKKVMVIGGGLAGLEAARVLAERGHEVSLYERGGELGGAWSIAAAPLNEPTGLFATLTKRLIQGVHQAGVKVNLSQEVTAPLVRQVKPEAIVVATGATPRCPDVPGIEDQNVVQANDVLLGKARVGERVVVIGGRYIGLGVAKVLVGQGKKVSVVDQIELGKGMENHIFVTLRDYLIEKGVQFFPHAPLVEVLDNGVYINFQKDLLFLKADTVVLAVGMQSENKLAKELQGLAPEVYAVGDCIEPRDAREAIYEGAEVGRQI